MKKILFSNFKLVGSAPVNKLYKYPDETDSIETRIVDLFVNLKSYFSFDFIKNYADNSTKLCPTKFSLSISFVN
jgi:hypothetical protein